LLLLGGQRLAMEERETYRPHQQAASHLMSGSTLKHTPRAAPGMPGSQALDLFPQTASS
jgi:hypothetical protein